MRKLRIPISILLTVMITLSAFTAVPFAANAAELPDITNGDLICSPFGVESNGSVGEILGAAVEQNEQTDDSSESITDVVVNGKTATVSLTHTQDCTVVTAVYDESGDNLLQTAIRRGIPWYEESIDLAFDSELPAYFYLRAFILDENCAPLGKQYETNRYTSAYREFLEKTTGDFPAANVINFDGDDANNFAVFDSAVNEISVGAKNIPAVVSEGYVFSNADESVKDLQPGDIFYFDHSGEPEVVKVGAVSVSGDTVTVTPADAQMEEVFDYVKIDVTADEAEPDMSVADEGVSLAAPKSGEPVGAMEYEQNLYRILNFNLSRGAEQGGAEVKGIEGELEMTTRLHFKLYYSDGVMETELKEDVSGELDASVGVSAANSFRLCKLRFPTPVTGLFIAVEVEFEPEISAAFHGKVNFNQTAGFIYNSDSGFTNLCKKPQLDAQVDFEGKIYIGFKLTPSIEALLGVVEVGVALRIGAEGVGTRVLTTTDTKACEHRCRWCIDGTINGKVEIAVEIETGFWKGFKRSVSAKLLDYEKELFDFYVSSELGFGKDDCPNSQPVPEQPVTPYQRMDVTYEEREKADSYVLSADRLHIDVYVSGSGNVKSYNGFGLQKYVEDYNDRVYEKAESLYPYDWDKRMKYLDDHKIVYGYTCTYHISGFHAVSAYVSGDVYISGPTKVVVLNNCHSFHVPDSVEELSVSHTEETSLHLPASVKYISGFNGCAFTELTIPSTAEYVDAFDNCPISKLTILPPKKNLTIKGFYNCRIESLTIPAGVRSISNFMPLKKAVVQTDTPHLLQFFNNLEEVTFDTPVIGHNCCDSCPALKKVNFTQSVTCIGEEALKRSGVQSVTVPGTVKKIGQNAFRECPGLREVVMQEGVKQIERMTFADCPKLERVVLPSTVSFLCKDAFRECAQNVELDFCGKPWQWWNITAEHDHQKMIDVEYDASVFMNCTVFLNSDGSRQMKDKTGGEPVGMGSANGYADAQYLIAVEDSDHGMLNGSVTALVQVAADENGSITILDTIHPGGQYLNIYGTCRHPKTHTESGETESRGVFCDICGERISTVVDLGGQDDLLIGDTNGDGIISIGDVTEIQKYLAELVPFTDKQLALADTNGDGSVAIDDATHLQKYLAEIDGIVLGKT